MKKNKTESGFAKPKKTVEVRVILPWMIIALIAASSIGLIAGWFFHSTAMQSVRLEAVEIVKEVKNS